MRQSLQILDLPVDRIEAALVAVPFFEDQRPLVGPAGMLDWRLDGLLTAYLVQGEASGRAGDRYLVKANHKVAAEWVLFVGCGTRGEGDGGAAQRIVKELLETIVQAGFKSVAIGLPVEGQEHNTHWQSILEQQLKELKGAGLECQLSACDPSIYIN